MKIKHTFKGSCGNNYGYYAFIDGETNELVIGENWPREGGETFRGTYEKAVVHGELQILAKEAPKLANAIEEYYKIHLHDVHGLTLSCLRFGDKFYHNTHKYLVIDMDISACFISTAGKESSITCALDLESYKVFCFDKNLQVSPCHE